MSAMENVRAKIDELRTRVQTRVSEMRGGAATRSGLLSNFSSPELMKGPLVNEIKTRGLIATARSRIEKLRGATLSRSGPLQGEETIAPPLPREEIYA